MSLIKPFRALRPAPGRAAEILAPPYDVLSSAEARERAEGQAVELPAYLQARDRPRPRRPIPTTARSTPRRRENLDRMVKAGVLIRDAKPALLRLPADLARPRADRARRGRLARRLRDQPRPQARADHAGEGGRPRPPDRGGQRPDRPGDDRLSRPRRRSTPCWPRPPPDAPTSTSPPTTACATRCGWSTTSRRSRALTRAFDALPAIYIADGHHRSAAAARVAQARGGATGSHGYFLSVIFPHHQMTILDYNRVVRDLNGRSAEQLLAALRERFTVDRVGQAGAPRRIAASSACISPAAGTG